MLRELQRGDSPTIASGSRRIASALSRGVIAAAFVASLSLLAVADATAQSVNNGTLITSATRSAIAGPGSAALSAFNGSDVRIAALIANTTALNGPLSTSVGTDTTPTLSIGGSTVLNTNTATTTSAAGFTLQPGHDAAPEPTASIANGTASSNLNVEAIGPGGGSTNLTIDGDVTLTGTRTWNIDFHYDGDYDQPATTADIVNVIGVIPHSATITAATLRFIFLNAPVSGIFPAKTMTLIHNTTTGALNGPFAAKLPNAGGLLQYIVHDEGVALDPDGVANDVTVEFTAVPEPGSLGLLAVAGLGIMHRRRRACINWSF